MNFITTQNVINAAVKQKVTSEAEQGALKSYLNALDKGLDGKLDGGFGRAQIKNDVYMSVPDALSGNRVLTKKINETMLTLLCCDQNVTKPKEEKSMLMAGLEIFLLIALFPLTITGCGTEHVECERECVGSCDMCTVDDEGEESCECPTSYCHWEYSGSSAKCESGTKNDNYPYSINLEN